mgnify:CR=1 FL=1|tara:strand:- start:864 stop:1025 length:162 start_codon:yes stop_codon:yes gene_type:complete
MPLVNKNVNTIPAFRRVLGGGGPPPVVGDFIELEPNLFLVALESALTDKIELE